MAIERRTLRALIDLAGARQARADEPALAQELAECCIELLPITACAVLLADPDGELGLVAVSRCRARYVGLLEVSHGQGPAIDSFRTASAVHCDDLAAAGSRWPVFVPTALADGTRAVSALPMRRAGRAIGAIDLVREHSGPLPEAAVELGQTLADSAAIGIARARAMRRGDRLADQWRLALDRRVLVQQASGILAERLRLPVEQAARLLSELAAADGVEPHALAARFVADPAGSNVDGPALVRALERAAVGRSCEY